MKKQGKFKKRILALTLYLAIACISLLSCESGTTTESNDEGNSSVISQTSEESKEESKEETSKADENSKAETEVETSDYPANDKGAHSDFPIDEKTGSAGQRVKTSTNIHGFAFKTWEFTTPIEATYSVFSWKGDYETTVSSDALVSFRREKGGDQRFDLEEPLPAGEYLFLIHDTTGLIGLERFGNNKTSRGYSYSNGTEFPLDISLTLCCEVPKGTSNPFLPCDGVLDELTGKVTVPEEAKIPEDSLIYTHPVMPDTWVFTDGLGRVSLTNEEVGDPKEDKTLAMFYWDWHASSGAIMEPINIQNIITLHPEAKNDFESPYWPKGWVSYFWNEPIYGYYRLSDPWVVRRQAELLANAGVDVIFNDNTNGSLIYKEGYDALFQGWTEAQNDGVNVPKISFMLPLYPGNPETAVQAKALYLDIYRNNKYQNLWYYLDGKPMLIAHEKDILKTDRLGKEVRAFFTFRNGYAGYIDNRTDEEKEGDWGWLSVYPQAVYKNDGKVEQVTVGVAQNHDYIRGALAAMNGENITGRSYTSDYPNRYLKEGDNASLYGYNFAEQFEYAISLDPEVIFVTGWNEWNVGRNQDWLGTPNGFPDAFSDEFSRDIEPSRGALKDHYYYQLVNYVRQYKGARSIPTPSGEKTIDMNGGEEQWSNVAPYYAAYIGNTEDRNARGCKDIFYTDFSGRNDIIGAQVARDDKYLYFHVECAEDITSYTDDLWMNLYIDCNSNNKGWESFDYVVNKTKASATTSVLERFTGNGYESKKVADVSYTVNGRYMTVKIAKSDLGIKGDNFTVNFSWTDNVHDVADNGVETDGNVVYKLFSGDILDFYTSGDVAPGGRFKYSYVND